MVEVRWQSSDGRKHRRVVESLPYAETFLKKQVQRGGVQIGEPIQLEKRWLARWRDAKGKDRKKPFPTETAAKAHLLIEDGKRGRGEWHDPRGARRTLAEVFEEQTAAKPYAPATLELHRAIWRKHVEPKLGGVQIGKIDTLQIDALLAGVARPEMRQKTRALLALLFGYAVQKRWLTISPVSKPKRGGTRAERIERGGGSTKDRRRYLNEKELALLLAETPERWRAMVQLMARMGLRPGEAVALTVGKFDPLRRALVVDTSVSGFTKTGESRTLTLPKVIAETLQQHIEEAVKVATWTQVPGEWDHPDAPMFPKEDGTAIDSKNSADAWRRRVFMPAASRAGLGDRFTVNSLRHSAASFAIAHGADVYVVQRLLGHARPSITLDVYGELWDSSAERLAERLDEAIRQAAAPEPGSVIEMRPTSSGTS